jgi:hypothetical protein
MNLIVGAAKERNCCAKKWRERNEILNPPFFCSHKDGGSATARRPYATASFKMVKIGAQNAGEQDRLEIEAKANFVCNAAKKRS